MGPDKDGSRWACGWKSARAQSSSSPCSAVPNGSSQSVYTLVESDLWVSGCGHQRNLSVGQELGHLCTWFGRPVVEMIDEAISEGWETGSNA